MTFAYQLELVLRIIVAAGLGALIGWQREKAHKPAGLRTHTLIAIGAALFTIASLVGFPGSATAQVAAGVVTGVGFLGAGSILHHTHTIEGLTTAASIWVVAAIGLAVGVGLYVFAALAALIVFFVLYFNHPTDST